MQALLASENLFFELPLLLAITLTLIQLIGGLEAGHAQFQSLSRDMLFCHRWEAGCTSMGEKCFNRSLAKGSSATKSDTP